MPKFLVKSKIQMDGKTFEPGQTIELSAKQAAEMPWAVEPIAPPKEAPKTEEKKKPSTEN